MRNRIIQNRLVWAIGAGMISAAGLTGCKPANQFMPPPPPEVTVARPDVRDTIVPVSMPGRVQATDTIEIRARVEGYLRSVDFEDGKRVEAGQTLCVIEPEPYETALVAALAKLAGAQANEEIARINFEKREQAYETRAISEIDKLKAKADYEAAQAIRLGEESSLTQARLNLSYTTNLAPAAGRISRKMVSEGNLVGGANPTLITTLVVDDPIHFYFTANERQLLEYLAKHNRGQRDAANSPKVKLRLADGQVYDQEGEIDFLDNQVDPQTGTIVLRAIFPNPEGKLLPGLYADILVPDEYPNAVLVPDLSILRDIGGTYVLVVGEGNKVESKYVSLGPKVDDLRIVEKGLNGQERVVVQGVQRARPGLVVQPKEMGTESPEA